MLRESKRGEKREVYKILINNLLRVFGNNLKTVVLFGFRAKEDAMGNSDHDLFLIIDNLPDEKPARLKQVRMAIWDIQMRVNTIAETQKEMGANLTPLLLDICVDGICFYGKELFDLYRKKAKKALVQSGLQRNRVG